MNTHPCWQTLCSRGRNLLATIPPKALPVVVLGLFATSLSGRATEASSLAVTAADAPKSWTITYKKKPVLVYAFDPQKFKPYVKELRTTAGENVLRDSPSDHLHHHALMYGIKVNGMNFWEETSGNGVQKPVQSPEPVITTEQDGDRRLARATITQVLHWVAPQDAFLPDNASVALLVEHRTLVLTVDEQQRETALEWKSRFEVGPKTNVVVLTGANYHGLGMRFLEPLDALAEHSLAGARPDLANNRQDVSAAPWASVSFAVPDHPATLVLAGHPGNPRGDATYFSMLTPFAYLSATQGLDKEPLVYRRGDTWELKYLVLLCSEAKPADTLKQHVERWRHAPL